MSLSRTRVMALAALVASTGASAQLKMPKSPAAPSTPLRSPAAPAIPASTERAPAAEPAALSESEQKEAMGKLAAAGWLTLLDRRDWGTAWEGSALAFRTTVPLATWMDAIPKVREPLGLLQERVPAESSYKTVLPGRPAGDYVTVIFLSRFDNKELQEIVTTALEQDGRWRVTGYSTR